MTFRDVLFTPAYCCGGLVQPFHVTTQLFNFNSGKIFDAIPGALTQRLEQLMFYEVRNIVVVESKDHCGLLDV